MKKRNEVVRIKSIVKNDRFSVGEEFYNIVISDTSKVLREYFDFKNDVLLNISKTNDGYRVLIEFYALNIKPFTKLP